MTFCFLQVNEQNMSAATHEHAAQKLKAPGSTVTMLVKYNPEGELGQWWGLWGCVVPWWGCVAPWWGCVVPWWGWVAPWWGCVAPWWGFRGLTLNWAIPISMLVPLHL